MTKQAKYKYSKELGGMSGNAGYYEATSKKTDPKEISRRKTARLTAFKNLVARRMGYKSWSNFGKQFTENLYPLEEKGTQAQVNAVVRAILLRSAKAVLPGANELDRELQEVIKNNPRIRKVWKK